MCCIRIYLGAHCYVESTLPPDFLMIPFLIKFVTTYSDLFELLYHKDYS